MKMFFFNFKNGVFIDLGCGNFKSGSNTYTYEKELNWRGVGIDVIENNIDIFNKNRQSKAILAAVSNVEDKEVTIVIGGGATGVLDETSNKYILTNNSNKNRTFKFKTTTLTSILIKESITNNIDFLSLDVEGHELQVLQGLDFNQFNINVILTEKNTLSDKAIHELLSSKGYTKLTTPIPSDNVYVKKHNLIKYKN